MHDQPGDTSAADTESGVRRQNEEILQGEWPSTAELRETKYAVLALDSGKNAAADGVFSEKTVSAEG
jgi:hypothetical protein